MVKFEHLSRFILLAVTMIMISSCGQESRIEMPEKEQFQSKEESDTEGSDLEKVDIEDSNAEDSNTEDSNAKDSNTEDSNTENSNTENSNTEDSDEEDSNIEDSNTGDSDAEDSNIEDSNAEDSNTNDSNTEQDDMDLVNSEDFDPDNYTSDLVFIKQEEDIWRVVDNQGNVFRVSTSYEGLTQGIIGNGAIIKTNTEGDKQLSLTRSYTLNQNVILVEGEIDESFSYFVEKIFDSYLNSSEESEKLSEYFIQSTEIRRQVGKGAYVIEFSVNVKPSHEESKWSNGVDEVNGLGWIEDITSSIVVYGYEDTWILPRYTNVFDRNLSND